MSLSSHSSKIILRVRFLTKSDLDRRNSFTIFRVREGETNPLVLNINGIKVPTFSIHCAMANILTLTTEFVAAGEAENAVHLELCAILAR